MKFSILIVVIQLLGLAVLLFGDVGFDKAGRFGLDFRHFLVIAAVEIVAFIAAIWLSVVRKSWVPVLLSAFILFVGVLVVAAI